MRKVGLLAAAACLTLPLSGPATAAAADVQPAPVQLRPGPDLAAPATTSAGPEASASSTIGRGKLERRLGNLARQAPGASGFFVSDIHAQNKKVLFKQGAGKRRRLASNTKLFTTATALHRLGHRSTIETRLFAGGPVNAKGRLRGDLFIVGAGDPSLTTSKLNDLSRQVKRAGITRIGGDLVGDDTVFDHRRGVPDSNWGPSPWIAPLSGLVVDGSTYSGDPARAAVNAFRSALKRREIGLVGMRRTGKMPGKLRGGDPLASVHSPTIASLATTTNKSSHNFYAEMLLKRLWAQPGRTGTTNGGAKAVARFAESRGSGIRPRDGSGLTANNKASAREVVRLLAAMRAHRSAGAFHRSLAIAGRDGTLGSRMRGTAAEGRCRGKTGTISGVSVLSGYCNAGRGGKVAFALLMNSVSSADAARNLQDRMVGEIARYRP